MIIDAAEEPLTPEQADLLRKWLLKPEAGLLKSVIRAKCQRHQLQALSEASQSVGDDTYRMVSSESMREANRYEGALQILEEFSRPTTPLITLKLK